MEIIRQQRDEESPGLWHLKIAGADSQGIIRLADLSRETDDPAAWLAANEAEAQAAIEAGVVNEAYNERLDLDGLESDIAGELDWILAAQDDIADERAEIVTGIGVIDGGATLAQLRQVVRGLALIVDNTLQRQNRLSKEQERELKAWRFVIRNLNK